MEWPLLHHTSPELFSLGLHMSFYPVNAKAGWYDTSTIYKRSR